MKYKVIDNFLPSGYFKDIKNILMSNNFACIKDDKSDLSFYNVIYGADRPLSNFDDKLLEFKKELSLTSSIKIRADMYPRTPKFKRHFWVNEFDVSHKGALFFINTNDGVTILETQNGKVEIDSVENRILIYDPTQLFAITTCTNQKVRVTLNFNYV